MQFLQTVKLIISLFPVLLEAVKAAEAALPGGGNGAQKLALVRVIIESAYALAGDVKEAFDKIWPALEKVVDAVVAAFNVTGIFRRG